ncbi:MAG: nickel pincer cofactor biosynthesis protein LarC [bacterium]|nr:nickel pincer cofactor biosynthesis protein LarC [bacterium]
MTETILYIDPFSGVSGDMLLAALISSGVPIEVIMDAVEKVIPGEVRISATQVTRSGLAGIKCDVEVVGGPEKRTLGGMISAVRGAGLDDRVAAASLEVLKSLGEAEARAHGSSGGAVHLHELGGQDTLADIVGVQAAIAWLNPDEIVSGSLNLGCGYVGTSHGMMPVPAPATAFLVEGLPVHSAGPEGEFTTPTGAALMKGVVNRFGPLPAIKVEGVGVGAGTADHDGFPNLLRVFRGSVQDAAQGESAVIIECGIDDLSPEYLAPAVETIQAAGAKEVHLIPVHTKKGRPGVLVRVLAGLEDRDAVVRAVLEATGSSGLRFWEVGRQVLPREKVVVSTPHGPVTFKRWRTPSGYWRFKPEYEEVRRLADQAGVPILKMKELAVAAYLAENDDGLEEN